MCTKIYIQNLIVFLYYGFFGSMHCVLMHTYTAFRMHGSFERICDEYRSSDRIMWVNWCMGRTDKY